MQRTTVPSFGVFGLIGVVLFNKGKLVASDGRNVYYYLVLEHMVSFCSLVGGSDGG